MAADMWQRADADANHRLAVGYLPLVCLRLAGTAVVHQIHFNFTSVMLL